MTCIAKPRFLYMSAGLVSILYMSGCATTPAPKIVYRDVPIAVSVACKPDPEPTAPDFADTDAKLRSAPDMAERARLYVIGRLQRIGYETELVATLKGCEGP